jgi:ABC-type cobalamin/Fe3+-siderophores transport system ATPase subunit
MIEVFNLSYSFGDKQVFSNVSFTVDSGKFFALLGANGSGKTTLFKTILNLYQAETGRVILAKEDITYWSRERIAQHVGYVPQQHTPPFPYKVIDVVLMGRSAHLKVYQAPQAKDYYIADEALATMGILELRDKIYTEISGGERQLVLIARSLAQQPKVLIMDEPTANLDFGNQIKVLLHIKALATNGITILMSTHNPDHALHFADTAGILSYGEIRSIGHPQDIITEDNLFELYGVKMSVSEQGVYAKFD